MFNATRPVTTVAAGVGFSLFLESDGRLWAMGFDADGQLGGGVYKRGATGPPELIVATNVTAIAAGGYGYPDQNGFGFSLFLKKDGSLWAMGYNYTGELGDGTDNNTNRPELLMVSKVTAIAAGLSLDSLFLKSDGSLWVTGKNVQNQLGDGTGNSRNIPEEIVSNGVVAVATGIIHNVFVKSDGSLWGMGDDSYGELCGAGEVPPIPREVVAGPVGYNQISVRLLNGGDLSLSYWGMAGTNYELDRSFSLAPANCVPQATNPTDVNGLLVFTNTPEATTNNFWRIRSMP
ncbi:MAG TPA: hypothetical protein VG077_20300 [Verrucomicrobiae bacterium]|nr:hypothetical protein [Verrucomicrobiae bacterium]